MAAPFESPFDPTRVRRKHITFKTRFLLLLMVIFSAASLGIAYALRVPAIAAEFNALMGQPAQSGDSEVGRVPQVVFVFFTVGSPLLMALFVNIFGMVLEFLARRRQANTEDDREFMIGGEDKTAGSLSA